MMRAIDISTTQGRIDWVAVRRSGVELAWCKASEGRNPSQKRIAYLRDAVAGARRAGVRIGAYHFARLGDIAAEHGCFERSVRGLRLDLPAWLDVEPTYQEGAQSPGGRELSASGYGFKNDPRRFTVSELDAWIAAWPDRCALLYSYRSLLEHITTARRLAVATRPWGVDQPPADPMGEAPDCQWSVWQYASRAGRCPGVDGTVDLCIARGL